MVALNDGIDAGRGTTSYRSQTSRRGKADPYRGCARTDRASNADWIINAEHLQAVRGWHPFRERFGERHPDGSLSPDGRQLPPPRIPRTAGLEPNGRRSTGLWTIERPAVFPEIRSTARDSRLSPQTYPAHRAVLSPLQRVSPGFVASWLCYYVETLTHWIAPPFLRSRRGLCTFTEGFSASISRTPNLRSLSARSRPCKNRIEFLRATTVHRNEAFQWARVRCAPLDSWLQLSPRERREIPAAATRL